MIDEALVAHAAASAAIPSPSVVVRRLDRTGEDTNVGLDRWLYPASMIKTPLALVAFTDVEEGRMHLDDTFEVTQPNMTANDKDSPLVPGYRAHLAQIIELMITISDNVATNMLYDILGRERATAMVREQYGLPETGFYRKLSGSEPLIVDPGWDKHHRNTHSARDAAHVFELIARDMVPFAALFQQMLLRQQWNEKLASGLRPGDRFAHKTGDTDEVTHDGGILHTEDGRSYVIVVYTGMESTPQNNAKFGPFMTELRKEM